jgi:hypothetical protein
VPDRWNGVLISSATFILKQLDGPLSQRNERRCEQAAVEIEWTVATGLELRNPNMVSIDNGTGDPANSSKKTKRIACAISGKERPRNDLASLETLRPSLVDRIRIDHPSLPPDALISRTELAHYRTLYVEELLKAEHGELTELDRQVAESIATHDTLAENIEAEFEVQRTLGERMSDHLATFGGSWTFIILFAIALAI